MYPSCIHHGQPSQSSFSSAQHGPFHSTRASTLAGICAVSKQLPFGPSTVTAAATAAVKGNGLNATFGEKMYCVAAEPHATFLRISVTDDGEEVAHETCVLGRLLRGYRVLQIRSALGTRIELAYILVHIAHSKESELNLRSATHQVSFIPRLVHACGRSHFADWLRTSVHAQTHLNKKLSEENEALKQRLVKLESSLGRAESFVE